MSRVSEQLKRRIESDLGLAVKHGPKRIYGVKGAAHRWFIVTVDGEHISSEDTMKQSVNAAKLELYRSGDSAYISII